MKVPFLKRVLGRQRPTNAPRIAPTRTAGVRGSRVANGYPYEAERNAKLRGHTRWKTYQDLILNVGIVASCVRYGVDVGAAASWNMIPNADGGTEAEEMADWTWRVLQSMTTSFEDVVARDVMYRYLGFSVQEWTAVRGEDGLLWLGSVDRRSQATIEEFGTDDNGVLTWFQQRDPATGEVRPLIPRWKCTYVVDEILGDDVRGTGLLRHVVPDSFRLQRYEQLEGWGYETDMRGVPLGWAPILDLSREVKRGGGITEAEADELIGQLETILQNHVKAPDQGILLDSSVYMSADDAQRPSGVKQWGFELLKGSSAGHDSINAAINRKAHDIARALGCEHLLLGSGPNGTRSLSEDKSRNFSLVMDRTLKAIGRAYDRDLIGSLWLLNGFDPRLKPRLQPEDTQFTSSAELVESVRSLSVVHGPLSPQAEAIQELYGKLGLPPPAEEDSFELEPPLDDDPVDPDEPIDDDDMNES